MFDNWYHTLLTTDKQALQRLGYDIADEQLMVEIKDDFDHTQDLMKTNENKGTFDNH